MTDSACLFGRYLLARRSFLHDMGYGLSSIALAQLLHADSLLGADGRDVDTRRRASRACILFHRDRTEQSTQHYNDIIADRQMDH